ncbi:uncharacterized protein LOC131938075 [Physella acuta]|uniref:uncharacterized protein LOC131938075 n=1 Tax=Physella acuta TaxID=109671 RepID=UPI0027DCB186|nr:uncharacterized protein LOC131938075 [Physella acuta]
METCHFQSQGKKTRIGAGKLTAHVYPSTGNEMMLNKAQYFTRDKVFGSRREQGSGDREPRSRREQGSGDKVSRSCREQGSGDKEPRSHREQGSGDREPRSRREQGSGDKEPRSHREQGSGYKEPRSGKEQGSGYKEPRSHREQGSGDKEPKSQREQGSGDREPRSRREQGSGDREPRSRREQGSGYKEPKSQREQGSGDKEPRSRKEQGSGYKEPWSHREQGSGDKEPRSRKEQESSIQFRELETYLTTVDNQQVRSTLTDFIQAYKCVRNGMQQMLMERKQMVSSLKTAPVCAVNFPFPTTDPLKTSKPTTGAPKEKDKTRQLSKRYQLEKNSDPHRLKTKPNDNELLSGALRNLSSLKSTFSQIESEEMALTDEIKSKLRLLQTRKSQLRHHASVLLSKTHTRQLRQTKKAQLTKLATLIEQTKQLLNEKTADSCDSNRKCLEHIEASLTPLDGMIAAAFTLQDTLDELEFEKLALNFDLKNRESLSETATSNHCSSAGSYRMCCQGDHLLADKLKTLAYSVDTMKNSLLGTRTTLQTLLDIRHADGGENPGDAPLFRADEVVCKKQVLKVVQQLEIASRKLASAAISQTIALRSEALLGMTVCSPIHETYLNRFSLINNFTLGKGKRQKRKCVCCANRSAQSPSLDGEEDTYAPSGDLFKQSLSDLSLPAESNTKPQDNATEEPANDGHVTSDGLLFPLFMSDDRLGLAEILSQDQRGKDNSDHLSCYTSSEEEADILNLHSGMKWRHSGYCHARQQLMTP